MRVNHTAAPNASCEEKKNNNNSLEDTAIVDADLCASSDPEVASSVPRDCSNPVKTSQASSSSKSRAFQQACCLLLTLVVVVVVLVVATSFQSWRNAILSTHGHSSSSSSSSSSSWHEEEPAVAIANHAAVSENVQEESLVGDHKHHPRPRSSSSSNEPIVTVVPPATPRLPWDVALPHTSSTIISTATVDGDSSTSATMGEIEWACPSLTDDPMASSSSTTWTVPRDMVVSGLRVVIPSTQGNELCQLHVHAAMETRYLARSYQGFPWEAYANRDSLDVTNRHHHHHVNNNIQCQEGSSTTTICVLEIVFAIPPTWDAANDPPYVLVLETKTQRTPMTPAEEAARFFEQTTFGTTRNDIRDLLTERITTTSSLSLSLGPVLAQWVYNQQSVVPATPHREYFRHRLNSRFEGSHRVGHATHPCRVGTWYRRAALSDKDRRGSLTISTLSDNRVVLRVGNEIRTVVDGPVVTNNRGREYPDGTYAFCSLLDGDRVNSRVRLIDPVNGRSCRSVSFGDIYGNPPVELDDEHFVPEYVVALDGQVIPRPAEHERTRRDPDLLYLGKPLRDDICTEIVRTAGEMPVVFGLFDGKYYIHDPRFELEENTVENPLPDGGGNWVYETAHSPDGDERILCANAPRTIFNQEHCVMSTLPRTCTTSDELPTGSSQQNNNNNNNNTAEDSPPAAGVVVCGSPGEVSNKLSLPLNLNEGKFDIRTSVSDTIGEFVAIEQQKIAWVAVALWSQDQLRQRVAWALSQIFAVRPNFVRRQLTEAHLSYYDIFVRHAFGNFRDIVREVAYSPQMGVFLSYIGSTSTAYQWDLDDENLAYPDENFAREIMQLFVLGLYKLNQDGSVKRDDNGAIRLYSNHDIMEYARVWTGFNDHPHPRGNIEDAYAHRHGPRIDPMVIEKDKRDRFPKMGLDGQYIGDGYPLCTDLPSKHFLKKGAVYRVLGSNPTPELQYEPSAWVYADKISFAANTTAGPNSLFAKLCAPEDPSDVASPCAYPGMVTLTETVACYGDLECKVDTISTVEVGDGIFYEYVRPPCVHRAYFANPEKIERHQWANKDYMCADPLSEVASTVCCEHRRWPAFLEEAYWGEKVRFSTARARCTARTNIHPAVHLCSARSFSIRNCEHPQCDHDAFYWTGRDGDCLQQAKIDRDGKVAIVHHVLRESGSRLVRHVREDNPTFFRVHWSGEVQTLISTCRDHDRCEIASDGNCLCEVFVTEEVAFDRMPSHDEVLSLTIGAFDPEVVTGASYDSWTENNVTAYIAVDQPDLYTSETIFEVVDEYGRTQRRKNIVSTVTLSGFPLSFRNPVHFVSLVEGNGDLRDSTHETEAALDHYFYHENAAPFLAVRLAQRFGISNPSPRYISTIAEAFKSGTYEAPGEDGIISFGDGIYGNMAATVAAVILDREARTPLLDTDQLHGSMREPWLKVMGLMRSMEFEPFRRPFPRFSGRLLGIGQMPHEILDVFSFFNPWHQPDGAVSELGLVSPESDLHVTPNIVNMINGLASLIKYGFDHCYGGFGAGETFRCSRKRVGDSEGSTGVLSFVPSSQSAVEVVDELATILTSGRLSDEHKSAILAVFEQEPDTTQAVIKAQQMIIATPEYHTTGTAETSSVEQVTPTAPSRPLKPYKAVVQVHLHGGVDSFNVIVPHAGCRRDSSNTPFDEQYRRQRGNIAIGDDERDLLIAVEGQPCAVFAINENIPILQQLYNDGDLAFVFNTGVLNRPSTKDNYEHMSLTQLFAHNTMRYEIYRLDPFDDHIRSGVMGRLATVLSEAEYSYSPKLLAIDQAATVLTGGPSTPFIVSREGPRELLEHTPSETFDLKDVIPDLNNVDNDKSSVFARTWSQRMLTAMSEAEELVNSLNGADVHTSNSDDAPKFEMITKWLQTHQTRGADRDLVYVEIEGWDHHHELREQLTERLQELNAKLTFFVNELKALGLWNNVTLVMTSDFGRTLTANSGGGSDHGWGGHTFVLGGGVKGRQILGEYPDVSPNSPLNLGRGRILPTLSWESIWNPIVEWMGVRPVDGDYSGRDRVIPNAAGTGTVLLDEETVFLD